MWLRVSEDSGHGKIDARAKKPTKCYRLVPCFPQRTQNQFFQAIDIIVQVALT